MVTRAKAKLDPNDNILIELLETLKKAKHELKIEINRSKKARWKELCDELKDNVWGKVYRIVMKKLNSSYSNRLPKETIVEQVHQLFPASQVTVWDRISIKLTDISLFTYEELMMAANSMKLKKSAETDGFIPEVIKICVNNNRDLFCQLFNKCLTELNFPKMWKVSRLVLIEKPK